MKNKLGLGTVQFGLDYGISNYEGKTNLNEAEKILRFASTAGIDLLDTAAAYGDAETIIGRLDVQGFKIVSKFIEADSKLGLQQEIKNSFQNLGVKRLYGYLAHRPLSFINSPPLYEQTIALKNEGLIEKIGASFNTTDELEAVLSKNLQLDIVQLPYNYFDRRFEKYFSILSAGGCEIHVRSVYLQGLFFADLNLLGSFFDPLKPALIQLRQKYNHLLPTALLQFALRNEFVNRAIIGVNTAAQLVSTIQELEYIVELPPITSFDFHENLIIPSNWPKK